MIINDEFFKNCILDRTELRRLLNFVSHQYALDDTFLYTTVFCWNFDAAKDIIKYLNNIGIYSDKELIDKLGLSFWEYEINEENSLNSKCNKLM